MSPLGASFLHVEDAVTHMHIGSVGIFEGPGPGPDELRSAIATRLSAMPRYRQTMDSCRWPSVARAWVDDPHLDLDYRVRRKRDPGCDGAGARTLAADARRGLHAYRAGKLSVRQNLHLGIGVLAPTSGLTGPGRLRFRMVTTRRARLSTVEAGVGPAVVAVHGLGATKGSFLPTVVALSHRFRVTALDLPGFGDSDKPLGARYDAGYFARAMIDPLDAIGLDRAHLIGSSLGGRVALEVGIGHPDRVPGGASRRGGLLLCLIASLRPARRAGAVLYG
jgi:hypothetical protein